ncbi:hypothetical protein CLU79DRAFT_718397 [Phycomyces nitens]|nr:hypothetical protein CLU79DRAFT_718397 [Phycomyces nitens]
MAPSESVDSPFETNKTYIQSIRVLAGVNGMDHHMFSLQRGFRNLRHLDIRKKGVDIFGALGFYNWGLWSGLTQLWLTVSTKSPGSVTRDFIHSMSLLPQLWRLYGWRPRSSA